MATRQRRVGRGDEDLVRLYLNDFGQHALLSKNDEVRLAQQIEATMQASAELSQRGTTTSPTEQKILFRFGDDGSMSSANSDCETNPASTAARPPGAMQA
jgi:hypothetical protein